ncbi:MAG TPA: hypothetical protein VNF47_17340 [Streptosporangiaceae bacterium]|nr:hypothetical protein [Streptosporangiaceae bacterium]
MNVQTENEAQVEISAQSDEFDFSVDDASVPPVEVVETLTEITQDVLTARCN